VKKNPSGRCAARQHHVTNTSSIWRSAKKGRETRALPQSSFVALSPARTALGAMQQGPHARRAQFGSRSGSMCITIAATSLQSFVLGSVLPATVAEFENFLSQPRGS
jgi:hypothetical protein